MLAMVGPSLDVAVRSRHDDEVVVGDDGVRLGVSERFAGALHADDRDLVLRPHAGLVQSDAADELRRVHLGEHEVVVEADEVQHPAAHEVRDALAGLALGVDDVVGADARQDLAVRLRDGLGPDLRDLEVDEVRGDEDGCLDERADGDDGDLEVLRADLLQRIDVAGVALDGMGDAVGPLLHEFEVLVHGEHLAVEPVQLAGARGAEASESDDQHWRIAAQTFNQRSAFRRAASRAAFSSSRRRPRRVSLYQRAP
jgi:hypothetical protein